MRGNNSRLVISQRRYYQQNSTSIGLTDLDEAFFAISECRIQSDGFEGCRFFSFVRKYMVLSDMCGICFIPIKVHNPCLPV